eukprot:Protomagalhaensia_sp_Gyna_25__4661@NODE_438_length_3443_cov_24_634841_g338_i0_p3_GENE_NODE_438_length_3443_cov_24_634841_g338_i0NODE_438_length_3443_cov_24_634841_g338_i0_p3_ORF_typecomplete_len131_score13_99_NODE_438_length_3443_cov_24_634841_g338_i012011593
MSVDMVIRSKDWDSGDEEGDVELVSIEDPTPQDTPMHPTPWGNCSPNTEDLDSDSLEEFDLRSTSWGKLNSPSASPTPPLVSFARKISMFSPQSATTTGTADSHTSRSSFMVLPAFTTNNPLTSPPRQTK